ncbi:hypothetical protein CPB85DRAFT_1256457 [Mucidula mucida]|nr:hypothetical protein CPB85DRAFT_1256457 [Mucidula mucida]
MSSTTKVYLVTGANRGIGLALVNEIASRNADKDIAVIAAVRDISSQSIADISGKYPGKIHALKYVAGDAANNQALAEEIKAKFGHVDTVIANAAIGTQFEDHFHVNALGVVVLFQAFYGLLKASKEPKFIPISSSSGSITVSMGFPVATNAYGVSKIALNFIARRIHFENDWLVCFPLDPGPVDTDMGQLARKMDKSGALGALLDAIARTTEVAATKLIDVIEDATREKDGGEFVDLNGGRVTW